MKTVLQLCGAAALAAFAYLCLTLALTVNTTGKHLAALSMQAGDTLAVINTQLPSVTGDIHTATQAAQGAISDVRKALPPLVNQVTADLQEGHRVILEAGLTAMEARKASAEERAALPALTAGAQDAIEGLNREMAALQSVTVHADALVSDPNIPATIAHVESTTGHLDATAGDVQQEVHSLTHPTLLHKIWGGLLDVAHVFNPL